MRRIRGRYLGVLAAVVALVWGGQWAIGEEMRYRDWPSAWDQEPLSFPLFGLAENSAPERDFPWEALLGGLALGGGAIGWVLSEFKSVDHRLDEVEAGMQKLASADELARQQHEASLLLLQRDLHLLENALRELQTKSDRHDRRLYNAVENLKETLKAKGLLIPRSQTPDQRGWPTDDPPTGAFSYHRPSTPPPSDPDF